MLVTGGCAPLQVLPLTVLGRDARPQPVRGRVWGPCWHTDTQCQPPVIVASPAICENVCSQIIKDTMRSLVLVRLTLMPQCPGSWETQLAGPWSCVVMPGSSSLVSDVTEQMRLCRVPPQPARARAEWDPGPGTLSPTLRPVWYHYETRVDYTCHGCHRFAEQFIAILSLLYHPLMCDTRLEYES